MTTFVAWLDLDSTVVMPLSAYAMATDIEFILIIIIWLKSGRDTKRIFRNRYKFVCEDS